MGRRRRKSIKRPRSWREHRLQGFFILQKMDSCIGDIQVPQDTPDELLYRRYNSLARIMRARTRVGAHSRGRTVGKWLEMAGK